MKNEFIRDMFREYYKKDMSSANIPLSINKREFGFILFSEGMVRHKKFSDASELTDFLQKFAPSDAYYSCAYYENPEAEMDKKGWLGADLVFDIDADHIPTPCDKLHDEWVCGACGFSGKGVTPEACPACGKEKFEANTWPCEICLESAKEETIKLLDMLTRDFGLFEKEMHVFFSGHRGYHVHVESETVQALDTIARKEIVDYCCGLGFNAELHGLGETSSTQVYSLSNIGWNERLMQGLQKFIHTAEEEDFGQAGLNRNVAETIMLNKETILKHWLNMQTSSGVKGVGPGTLKKIIEHVAKLESAKIDTVVTTDTHRLIRLAGTLHSKTGFKKVEFPASAIDKFDPFTSGIAFTRGTAKVRVSCSPAFRIGAETFNPYKNQEIELPTAAAMLLICRGRAEVVEQNV